MGDVTLNGTDIVIASELEVLQSVSNVIDQTPSRTLQNYLVGRFVISKLDFMPKRFRAIKQQLIKVFYGSSTERSRKLSCAKYVARNMGLAVSKLYITKYFDKDARKEVGYTR